MKRLISTMMAICLLLAAGCASAGTQEQNEVNAHTQNGETASNSSETLGMTLGYVPSRVDCPEWMNRLWGWDTCADTIWMGCTSNEGEYIAAAYDTLTDTWREHSIDTADAHNPVPQSFSVSGDSYWILFRESYTREDIINGAQLSDLKYYISYYNLDSSYSLCTAIPFSASAGTESSNADFCSVQAIDAAFALLTSYNEAYLIDPAANMLAALDSTLTGVVRNMRVNDKLYLAVGDGLVSFNKERQSFNPEFSLKYTGGCSSNNGNYLLSEQGAIYKFDPMTGEKTEVFKWIDAALSYSELSEGRIFENSKGDFYYPTRKGVIKVTQQQIPQKKTLSLVCFGDMSEGQNMPQTSSYSFTDELADAIIRFNNTDSEYKVVITPVMFSDENERDRLLIELATADDIDLIDTSILPENSIKAGFLVDLLPYIDADEQISQDDFIPSLLQAMTKNGQLYEYTDKFTLLTMLCPQELYENHAAWTVDEICRLMETVPMDCECRENLLEKFVLAATGEFIDWDKMNCSFNCDNFKNWLLLLKNQPEHAERYENPVIFRLTSDLAGDAGAWARTINEGEYAIPGFPNTVETGSYFVKLDGVFNFSSSTIGRNTRLGILAASKNQTAAWRFVRTLMLSEDEARITDGIPALKTRFEKVLQNSLSDELVGQGVAGFNEYDAELMRQQVYNTTKLAHKDEALLRIIRSEAVAYFEGQKSLDDAAAQIQSRVSIYLAEQS